MLRILWTHCRSSGMLEPWRWTGWKMVQHSKSYVLVFCILWIETLVCHSVSSFKEEDGLQMIFIAFFFWFDVNDEC